MTFKKKLAALGILGALIGGLVVADSSSDRTIQAKYIKNGSAILTVPTSSGTLLTGSGGGTITGASIDADANTITNIDDNEIKALAAIQRSKLANGTANHVIINNGSGAFSSEATLAKSRGGSGQDNSSLSFPASGTLATLLGTEAFQNKTLTSCTLDASANTVSNIANTNISSSAAIARSKLASGSANHVVINDGSGVLSSEAQLSSSRGGTGQDFSASTGLVKVSAGTMSASSLVNADVNAAAAIAYSKLNLSSSIVNADVNASAAIAYSKLNLSASILNADINGSAAIAYSKLAALSASKALQSDGSGFVSASSVTSSELGFLTGLTSSAVGTTQSQTLTNKVLTGNTAVNLVSGSGTLTLNTTGTITVPNATDTLVGKATTDALSNKEFTDSLLMDQIATPSTPAASKDRLYFKSDNNLYKLDSTGLESAVGTGSGGINYVTTPDGNSTTGWTTYADAAGVTPVDATGGSPNSTWTSSASAPLRGANSFLWTKSGAANRQGEGVSYAFTIDSADQSKAQYVSFDYSIASGTFSGGSSTTDSDLEVYVYDVTNAVVIQPTIYKLDCSAVGTNCIYKSQFQAASNSTSYRLAIHTATTSTSNYTVKFDNFIVGPQNQTFGVPVTDHQSFTMNISATTSAPTKATTRTIDNAQWWRVGDTMFIHYDYEHTSSSGAAAGTGTYLFGLPTGYTIDTTKQNAGTALGGETVGNAFFDDGTTRFEGHAKVYDSTHIALGVGNDTSALSFISSTFGQLGGAATQRYSFDVRVPILGWGSTTAMSSDGDQRSINFASYRITSGQTVTAGTPLEVVPNATRFDSHSAFSTSTGRFTAPVSGKYLFTAGSQMTQGATAAADISLYFLKNGTGSKLGIWFLNSLANSKIYTPTISATVDMNAGDYVSLWAESTTQNVTVGNSGGTNDVTYFYGQRLSNANQVGATESVAARYNATSSTAMAANDYVNYNTKVYDTHGAVTTGTGTSWKFVAPVSGYYQVSGSVQSSSGTGGDVDVMKNDVLYGRFSTITSTGSGFSGSTLVQMNAGDKVSIRVDSATTIGAAGLINNFSVFRVPGM